MYDLNKTIKHFKSLQKRYETEHNGQMCERVADALEALEFFKSKEDGLMRLFGCNSETGYKRYIKGEE